MAVRAETQIDLARVDDGTNGVSVTAVEPQYYLSTSDTSATGGSWSSTPATFVSGYYYWTRDYITFSDGTHDTSTEVYNAGMTQAAQDAYDAKTLADDTNQYFWYAPTGADTGAHITEVPQDEWNDISDPNYHSGGNLLARSTGIAVRDGMTELATFGTSGAVIGQNATDKTRTEIGADGMQIIRNESGTDTTIANIGYGLVIGTGGTPVYSSFYTFGYRQSNSAVGSYSTAEGVDTVASGPWSHAEGALTSAENLAAHAEGETTRATGKQSHAEGKSAHATNFAAHAEGYYTEANGEHSHAEGGDTEANGKNSHAQNLGTKASSDHQTALGKFNIEDTNSTYAVIVGNGNDGNARSNALTVDWSGNIVASGTLRASTETPTASVTASTGTLVSATAKRFGNVVQLLVTVQNSSSIAQGGNIFTGTLSTTALQPLMTTTTGSYYSTSAITATLATDGSIVIRNEGGSKSFTSNVNVSFTYIVA